LFLNFAGGQKNPLGENGADRIFTRGV